MPKSILIDSPYRVVPGKKVDLSRWSTDDTGDFKDKDECKPSTDKQIAKLGSLQDLFYASSSRALLIVLQAMDAGGKDGAIEHVFTGVNPQGCQVTSFKVPSAEERGHDFLWRHHLAMPRRGMIGIHNRSHYETVLVERVREIVPEKVWSRRYHQINEFEQMLTSEGTVILKFFLHISKSEQKRRLQARLDDKQKHWKFNPEDLAERARWSLYTKAFEDAMRNCSTDDAPWYVVPSDHKWFRNWVLSNTVTRALEAMDLKYPKSPDNLKNLKVE